ncbi:hypothetical protein N7540_005068 [Penicillium herquei]|nr:hypothetical protein N7540_005068 [Penicillium herquei]
MLTKFPTQLKLAQCADVKLTHVTGVIAMRVGVRLVLWEPHVADVRSRQCNAHIIGLSKDEGIPPTAVEPSVLALSEPSVASRSPDSNDGAISPSPAPSDLYAGYDDFLTPEVIEALMQVFYHNIYPIGIPVPPGLHGIQAQAATLSSQCYTIAVKAMPSDISNATDYCEAMKASAILASVCLQNEDMKKTVAHLGDYTSLSVMHGFYSEANWPLGLSEIEREERRRLYISTNFGLPSRQCEAKTTVLYPAEVYDDEDIMAMGTRTNPDRVSFLRGWNYGTDLYRLSENINSMMRAWQQVSREEPAGLLNSFLSGGRASKHFTFEILNLISKLHEELPHELKKVTDIAGNPHADWYGLIASSLGSYWSQD